MVKVEFYLQDEDVDRLFAIKKKMGLNDLTGNLHKMHPDKVKIEEE